MRPPDYCLPTKGCNRRNGVYHGDGAPPRELGEPMDAYLNMRDMLGYCRATREWRGPASLVDPYCFGDLVNEVQHELDLELASSDRSRQG